jgi:hypothetical protein
MPIPARTYTMNMDDNAVYGEWDRAAASRRSELRVWLVQGILSNWLDLLSSLVLLSISFSTTSTSLRHNHSIALSDNHNGTMIA